MKNMRLERILNVLKMNNKQLFLFNTIVFFITSMLILSMPIWADLSENEYGTILCIVFAIPILILSVMYFKLSKMSNEKDRPISPLANAIVSEKMRFYKKRMYMSGIAFIVLSIIVAVDLQDIKMGKVESDRTFLPIAFVYEHFGYWPAVIMVPSIGVICYLLFQKKLDKIELDDF